MTSSSDSKAIYSADAQLESKTNNVADESAGVVGKILGDLDFENDRDDMLLIDSIGDGSAYLSPIESASAIVLQQSKIYKAVHSIGSFGGFHIVFPRC